MPGGVSNVFSLSRETLLHKRLCHPSVKEQKGMGHGSVTQCKIWSKAEFLRKTYNAIESEES